MVVLRSLFCLKSPCLSKLKRSRKDLSRRKSPWRRKKEFCTSVQCKTTTVKWAPNLETLKLKTYMMIFSSSRVLLATKSYQDWWSSWIFTHFQDSLFVISLLKKSANSSVLNLESFCIFCCTDKFMMFCQQSWKEQKWNCWPSKKMNWFICGVNCCRLVYTLVLLQVSELKLDDLRPCKVKKDEKWCQYSN